MPKALKNILKFLAFLSIGLFMIWLAVKDMTPEQFQDVKRAFLSGNYWLVVPAFIIGIGSHLSRALRWKILIATQGHRPGTLNTFFAVMVGYLVNMGVPRLGEIARCGVLANYEKIPADKLIGTMIAERALDLVCLMLVFLLCLVLQLDLVTGYLSTEVWPSLQTKLANADAGQWLIILAIAAAVIGIIIFLFKRFAASKAAIKVRALMRGVWDGFSSIGKMDRRNLGWFIFHTVCIWFQYLAMLYVGFLCLPATRELGFTAALTVLVLGSVAMIVSPGGIGVYPFLIQKTLLLYNIPETTGVAFGWIIWGAQTLLICILGLLSFIWLPIHNKKS
ncbi:lysylphosphatidylglycerol synthase transmembrane domain-containing protein [Chitinophaga sp. XS-30]|uniref:lysylphosphatidylglycerol synthase transmembrane domain-containing protein n=1 Tax=Chitinophaga sp. XS-30 TaxID=2604421 RepID=UPI0011DDFA61|nr:lysylphosphatidylglycerol synthase transmembrane domain-containing protein [Chitinophaga sp. XS-30]QEH42604.1 flippase-like domain-containing protein [Chitinophaga sp. XS-30]